MSERRKELERAKRKRALTPHEKIQLADLQGRGLRLTSEDVALLATDDAIITRAEHDSLCDYAWKE